MIIYKVIYNEHFQPESVRTITDNGPNSYSPGSIYPLSIDATKNEISIIIQNLKDRQPPQE